MTGKVLSGCIVAFWLVMMGALVKVEFFPDPPPFDSVPVEHVLHKIFMHKTSASSEQEWLNVYYQEKLIGSCRFDVTPLASVEAAPSDPIGSQPGAYWMHGELALTIPVFGMLSKLTLLADGRCNPRYEIERFNLKTAIDQNRLEIRGDNRTKKLDLTYGEGKSLQKRKFDYSDLGGSGLADALGFPGLAHSSWLGGSGLLTAPRGLDSSVGARSPLTTMASYGFLRVGELHRRAYLVESKLNEGMWAKSWVDDSGQVLLVETSIGLTMRANLMDTLDGNNGVAAPVRWSRYYRQAARHDSN